MSSLYMNFCSKVSGRRVDQLLCLVVALICLLPSSLRAQAQPQPVPQPPPTTVPAPQTVPQQLTQEELNQLLGPIALYPDALIALMLPASTVPSDLVLAARFISSKGDPAQVANQPWDDSVKSLVRYPDIVKWMDQNLAWTTQLGEAFLDQPADVMNTIQRLRAQARAAGTLIDTPQQRVVEDEAYIRIVPAEPDVIYVPQYDPDVVYAEPYAYAEPYGGYPYGGYPYGPYFGAALTFGIGFAVGPWLNYDCDWPRRKVCVGDWNPRWRDDWNHGWRDDWDPEWRRGSKSRGGDFEVRNTVNVVNINRDTARVWEPNRRIQRQHWQRFRGNNEYAFNKNLRGRRSELNDTGRRFSMVEKPSRPVFDGQQGAPDRRRWRGLDQQGDSNFARNRSGEIRRPGSRVPEVGPGPQLGQGERKLAREWRGRARAADQSVTESNAMPKRNAQSFSKQEFRRWDGSQERKFHPNTESVRANRPSLSANRDGFRSQQFKRSVSKSESGPPRRQIKSNHVSSSSDVKKSRSERSKFTSSKGSDNSRQFRGGQGRSRPSQGTAGYSKSNKNQHSARIDRSGGSSRRPAASYSRQQGQQKFASAAGKGRGGGKKGSGGKGDKNKD
jgi:hypothetical protein